MLIQKLTTASWFIKGTQERRLVEAILLHEKDAEFEPQTQIQVVSNTFCDISYTEPEGI